MRGLSLGLSIFASLWALPVLAGGWDTAAFQREDTLQILTVGPEEGEHWSTVWLVVLDGDVYVRLGSRAAARMQANRTAPYVRVRVRGEEFDRIRAEEAPAMTERVADAMAEKYWSDLFIRFIPHPLTMRLVPDVQQASGGTVR